MRTFDLVVMTGLLGLGSAAMAGTLSLDRGVISAGGGVSMATGYGLAGTIGQPVAHSAPASVGTLASRAGFWSQVVDWVNTVPELAVVPNQTVDELSLLSFNLSATDADRPAQTLTYMLVSGPGGLSVSTAGIVAWTPTEAQGPGSYPVVVRVTDSGSPTASAETSFSIEVNEVADPISRTVWQIGTDNSPAVLPYRPTAEFSQENNRNDLRPGRITRLAGDPEYIAATNPTADDDFYFAGSYPSDFNGLLAPLSVPNDEPPVAWERAHTAGDRTNRVHFVLKADQVTAQSSFQLNFELVHGGSLMGGVVQPGFADHDFVVNFRNADGVTTQLFSQRVSQTTNIVIPFAASAVGAMVGANTVEIVRTGPAVSGVSYWIQYDYLRLESRPLGNTPPTLATPSNRVVDELLPLSFALSATDTDLPAQTLTYSRVSGPEGLSVSPTGLVTWTPTEAQGPGTYTVQVRVTDNGFPMQSDSRQFTVQVNEVADPVARTVWQIGIDNNPAILPYKPTSEFSAENNRNDLVPGRVTRLTGDPQYVAATNPTADDDFYFAGNYPVGFNGLLTPLGVPNDEPPGAWERAHTVVDRTNRVHLTLHPAQVTPTSAFLLSLEWVSGGSFSGGAVQPGFGDHDMVVRFRNGAGVATELFAQRVSQATNLVLQLPASLVAATAGANSLEIVRTGPAVAGVSYWIQYDYLRFEAQTLTNTAPVLGAVVDSVINEMSPFSMNLVATDVDLPVQMLTYGLVSGPPGVVVSPAGTLSWTPTEEQGPGTYSVTVQVTDNGFPTRSNRRQFTVQVNEVADLVLRTVWQIGIDNLSTVSPYRPTAEFSLENNLNDLPPGKITRLDGDPQYVAATNPKADDDFYFSGLYPTGFNGLPSSLSVPNDEPFSAWERAQTGNDRTNRMHFTLDPAQVT
ncbi:MAG: hypothetical protein RIS76_1521, partial [Verrucomicrobiota bacterium]